MAFRVLFMSNEVRPALFRVHEFDVGEKKQDENKEQQQEPLNAPALPPPSMK